MRLELLIGPRSQYDLSIPAHKRVQPERRARQHPHADWHRTRCRPKQSLDHDMSYLLEAPTSSNVISSDLGQDLVSSTRAAESLLVSHSSQLQKQTYSLWRGHAVLPGQVQAIHTCSLVCHSALKPIVGPWAKLTSVGCCCDDDNKARSIPTALLVFLLALLDSPSSFIKKARQASFRTSKA